MTADDRDFWEKFLNVYKSYPCLWDSKVEDYPDRRQLREKAKEKLLQVCKIRYPKADCNFVTKKIHSFRCAFRRELRKVEESAKANERYVPKLWYFNNMKFIVDAEMAKETKNSTNVVMLKEERRIEDSDNENNLPSNTEESQLDLPLSPRPESVQSSSSTGSTKRPRYACKFKYERLKGRNAKSDELLSNETEPLNEFCFAEVNQTPDKMLSTLNDFDIAGVKYSRDLMSLDSIQRNFAEKLVADVIFYAKQGKLTEHSFFQLALRYQPPTTIHRVSRVVLKKESSEKSKT